MRTAGGDDPPAVSRHLLIAAIAVLTLAVGCSSGSPATTAAAPSTTTTDRSTTSSPSTTEAVSAEASTAPTSTAEEPDPTAPLDVQGHRGARGLQPENTLPAFEVALDLGVDTLELDLHFTSDGEVVVWHDPTVGADKCESADSAASVLGSPIASLSRSDLSAFRCAKNPDPARFPDQKAAPTPIAGDDHSIVTLDELFDFVASYSTSDLKTPEQRGNAEIVRFNIETKRRPDQPETIDDGFDGETPGPFELAILDVIASADVHGRVTIQSFDHRSLRAIRTIDESIEMAALTRRNVPFDAEFATFARIWSPDYRSLSAAGVNEAHDAGMLVIPWTVNETSDMARLIDLGVDGLITDRPDLLILEMETPG